MADQSSQSNPIETSTTPVWRRFLPLGLIMATIMMVYATGIHKQMSLELVATQKEIWRAAAAQSPIQSGLVYVVAYAAVTGLSIPLALPMTLIGGLVFPLHIAIPLIVVGASTGAVLIFLATRSAFGDMLLRKGGDRIKNLQAGLEHNAASYLLFLRFVPAFPFAMINLAAGIFGVKLPTFVWTTVLGILPATAAYTFAASSIGSLLDDKRTTLDACRAAGRSDCTLTLDADSLVSSKMLMAFAALGVIALIPVLIRRFSSTTTKAPERS